MRSTTVPGLTMYTHVSHVHAAHSHALRAVQNHHSDERDYCISSHRCQVQTGETTLQGHAGSKSCRPRSLLAVTYNTPTASYHTPTWSSRLSCYGPNLSTSCIETRKHSAGPEWLITLHTAHSHRQSPGSCTKCQASGTATSTQY